MEFLSSSIAQLKVVQTKYVEAKDCLTVLNKTNEGKWLYILKFISWFPAPEKEEFKVGYNNENAEHWHKY